MIIPHIIHEYIPIQQHVNFCLQCNGVLCLVVPGTVGCEGFPPLHFRPPPTFFTLAVSFSHTLLPSCPIYVPSTLRRLAEQGNIAEFQLLIHLMGNSDAFD